MMSMMRASPAFQANNDMILTAAQSVRARRREQFFAPTTTDLEREAWILSDLSAPYGSASVRFPYMRVMESPFLFLARDEARTYVSSPPLASMADALFARFDCDFARRKSAEKEEQHVEFGEWVLSTTVATAAAAAREWDWTKDAWSSFFLWSGLIRASVSLTRCLLPEDVDALYADCTALSCVRWFWGAGLFVKSVHEASVSDEVLLRATSYVPDDAEGRLTLLHILLSVFPGRRPDVVSALMRDPRMKMICDSQTRLLRGSVRDKAMQGVAAARYLMDGAKGKGYFPLARRTPEDMMDIFLVAMRETCAAELGLLFLLLARQQAQQPRPQHPPEIVSEFIFRPDDRTPRSCGDPGPGPGPADAIVADLLAAFQKAAVAVEPRLRERMQREYMKNRLTYALGKFDAKFGGAFEEIAHAGEFRAEFMLRFPAFQARWVPAPKS